ncbi:MAG: outer membrane lipoprotein carrier protein LolA [Halorhabdus sp.]
MASQFVRSRWVWIIAIAVLLVGSTAIVGVFEAVDAPGEQPTFETNVTASQASIDGMTGIRETVIERGRETVRTVEHVWRRPGTGQYRIETINGTAQGAELEVATGESLWLYDVDDGRAVEINLDNASGSERRDRIAQILAIASQSDASERSRRAVSPLPVVPTDGGQGTATAGVAGSLTVQYLGTETVADRSTYVFELASAASTSSFVSNYTQTVWLDRTWYVPLKRVTQYTRDGQDVSITVAYRNVTLDADVRAGRFQFDPPANATVVHSDRPRQIHFADLAGVRAASSFSVPRPSVPDSFRLVDATRTVGDRVRSVGLTYTNATATILLSKSNLTWVHPDTDGKTVTIGNQAATLRNLGPELRVSWTCDGVRYSVAGSGVSSDRLLAVARSVDCQ